MDNAIIDLTFWQLLTAYAAVILLLAIFRWRGIRREKQILIASLRMTLQLTLMGYVLLFIFERPSWWLTTITVAVMIGFAIFNAIRRVRLTMPRRLKAVLGVSITAGTVGAVFFFIFAVVQVRPWFHPQYFIPIAGMITGNSMTGIALGANKLCSDMMDKHALVEDALMLGATPGTACRSIVNDAFDSAILPTMNNMLTMGIVSLPGMMTGQILSGAFPLTAIKYQIGIMLAILASTALTVVLFVTLGYRTFFSPDARLLYDELPRPRPQKTPWRKRGKQK